MPDDTKAAPAAEAPAPAAEPAEQPPVAEAAAPVEPVADEPTMTVEMVVGMEGGVSLVPGDPYECAQSEAIRLIEAGHAIPYVAKAKEKAVKKGPAETR